MYCMFLVSKEDSLFGNYSTLKKSILNELKRMNEFIQHYINHEGYQGPSRSLVLDIKIRIQRISMEEEDAVTTLLSFFDENP